MNQNNSYYILPMTLEQHFKNLSEASDNNKIENLRSLYQLLKTRLINILTNSRGIYVDYSYHDSSHSEKLIQIIERFLGRERISRLSATDTFMLLVCAYSHDYGMAKTYTKIYEILNSDSFKEYLEKEEQTPKALDQDDIKAIKTLLYHLRDNKPNAPLAALYKAILHVIQLYLRPTHSDDVMDIVSDFRGLFAENLQQRFIQGSEGIADICMCHGHDFKNVMDLSYCADGIVGDDFHPRFIAAMIRLADLLDLDNGRFPEWFLKETLKHQSIIPELSALHARKHEAITHLLITDERIDIEAKCYSDNHGFETASLVAEWTDSLKRECKELVINWYAIAQKDFGNAPGNINVKILVDGKDYYSSVKIFKMQMSQEKVMTLLEGTSIYQNRYVGIREILQNAVDASLLQLWLDLQQNRYAKSGITKDSTKSTEMTLSYLANAGVVSTIFNNYDIMVEVIKNIPDKRVIVVIKDKGVGISLEDIPYIANIGSSADNAHKQKIMKNMPEWLRPSGLFGIGLQSVFQITDCVEFYTRQYNQPERRIALYSYGRNRGRVEVNEVIPEEDLVFYNNSIPGTNAKIVINPDKIYISEEDNLDPSNKERPKLEYFDNDFHSNSRLDIIYAEVCEACKTIIRSSPSDYFRIKYQEIEQTEKDENGIEKNKKGKIKTLRDSYFINPEDLSKSDTDSKKSIQRPSKRTQAKSDLVYGNNCIPYLKNPRSNKCFSATSAFYWDEQNCIAYHLNIRPCRIVDLEEGGQVLLPHRINNLYNVHYKFNTLSKTDSIYSFRGESAHSHAGFISWDIYIFNNNQTKYLNIDRDQLKKDAIPEEELLLIRSEILVEWCEYLIGIHDQSNPDAQNARNLLYRDESVLLSFIILIYQNCERKQFDRFITKYGDSIEGRGLVIGNESILVTDLWNPTKRFFTVIGYMNENKTMFSEFTPKSEDLNEKDETENLISLKTLQHFPHRLIQEITIKKYGDRKLCFSFRFAHTQSQNRYVEMDDYARLLDYVFAIRRRDRKTKFTVNGIVKAALNPDSKYKHLIVTKYPITFQLNSNVQNYLSECIRSYLLSPFDRDVTTMLNNCIKNFDGTHTSFKELLEHVLMSEMYTNCVNYILKNSIYGPIAMTDVSNWKKMIEKEYTEFIIEFCRILHDNMAEAELLLSADVNPY